PVLLVPLGLAIGLVIRGQAARIPIVRSLFACALFAPWLARNAVVSGCLLYPVVVSCLDVPWAAASSAAGDAAAIKGIPHTSAWLLVWLRDGGLKLLIAWPAFVALGAAVAIMIQRRCRVVPTTSGLVFILAVYALAGTTWWVLMAPNPRFGFGHF